MNGWMDRQMNLFVVIFVLMSIYDSSCPSHISWLYGCLKQLLVVSDRNEGIGVSSSLHKH